MLTHVALENIAILSALDVAFGDGLNAITGETGAGKSVLLDGVQCVFDKRLSAKALLRHGAERGRVELTFDATHLSRQESLKNILLAAGLDDFSASDALPAELVLSREFTAAGSRCRVNGTLVAMPVMEALGHLLVEIVGQHDWHALFSTGRQRDLLDQMGGVSLLTVRQQVRQLAQTLQERLLERQSLWDRQADRLRQIDFIAYQINELTQANLTDEAEDLLLQNERDRLASVENLQKWALMAGQVLDTQADEQPGLLTQIGKLQKILSSGNKVDRQFAAWTSQLEDISAQLTEIGHQLGGYSDALDTRPEILQNIVDRLDTLDKVKRKYGGSLANALQQFATLQQEYEQLMNQETILNQWDTEIAELQAQQREACNTLTDLRRGVSMQLQSGVQSELTSLMMGAAQFEIDLTLEEPGESGQDRVQFLFSANPGEPLKPLAQVASGGELARLMLALKLRTAGADAVGTLIVDEIDTGMSGVTVRAVADKLLGLKSRCQVIAVTHQPIVAAQAHRHVHLTKKINGERVTVEAQRLFSRSERTRVLSQLVSGFDEQSDATLQFIDQLLAG